MIGSVSLLIIFIVMLCRFICVCVVVVLVLIWVSVSNCFIWCVSMVSVCWVCFSVRLVFV